MGDWKNHLTTEQTDRIDALVAEKTAGTGIVYDYGHYAGYISTMSLIRKYIACHELAISFNTHFCCRLACVNLAALYLTTLFC